MTARSGSSSQASTTPRSRSAKRKARSKNARQTAAQSARSKVRGKAGRDRDAGRTSVGREVMLVALGCLWVVIGTGLIGLSAGIWYGSRVAVNVLKEIAAHDYAGPRERIDRYESFFQSLDGTLYRVDEGQRNIDQFGRQSVGWVVTLIGSQERRRFQWEHDLESQRVRPRTNPALCLDVELGLLTEEQAQAYQDLESDAEQYDPDDPVVKAVVKSNYSISPLDLAGGWNTPDEEPVGAPLISPEEGQSRWNGREKQDEDEAAEQDESSDDASQSNDATTVIGAGDEGEGQAE